MLLVDSSPKSNEFQTINSIDSDESLIVDTSHSISPIKIPLISSEPILAVSPNCILVNEYTKKRNRLVFINDNLQRFSIRSPITETIIDALWYKIEQKFFLLTSRKIFTYNPNEKILESISDIQSANKKPFKSFTIDNNQSSLLIAYDEWESKFIEKWQRNIETNRWKLIDKYPLDLNSNEFIGIILAINDANYSKFAITIYNNLMQQWRMELRYGDMLTCSKKILLPGSDPMYDYRMLEMENITSDIKWLVHSQANNEIIGIDSEWKKIQLNYQSPVYRMVQFKEKNLIIRTRNRIDILLFV